MFPEIYVPRSLCSRGLYVPRVICSRVQLYWHLAIKLYCTEYVPSVLCHIELYVLCFRSSVSPRLFVAEVLHSKAFFVNVCIIHLLCGGTSRITWYWKFRAASKNVCSICTQLKVWIGIKLSSVLNQVQVNLIWAIIKCIKPGSGELDLSGYWASKYFRKQRLV